MDAVYDVVDDGDVDNDNDAVDDNDVDKDKGG